MENVKDLLKRSILKIQEQDRRIEELEAGNRPPIAIIGASGRFPGSPDIERFWKVVDSGADAVTTMTDQRWPMDAFYAEQAGIPGRINTRRFGLLDDVDQFDPSAFGISETEAAHIDPQHRLLLEQAWFCLERAGVDAGSMKGRDIGVFIGQMNSDYAHLVKDIRDLNAHFGIGNALSAAAGRLSYVFGLKGPSISLDTACSSSLVAVHLACQSLRLGECSMALAGGVNLLLSPEAAVGASVARMLSPKGRCNTFGDGADGYVRSEGCGLVLLKPLDQALSDGDPILAVIRGSAVNQDGRSNGMSAPSGPAQIEVMRRALAEARLDPAEVTYVETHGTGTPLGDPVEVQAIDTVYGQAAGRVSPMALGAVKANVGHCESAAGIAGLIKLVLMLQHDRLPPIAHLGALNPHFDALSPCLRFPTGTSQPWIVEGRRIGAVSSFGYTGTNAHVIVEQHGLPTADAPPLSQAAAATEVLCYAAHSATALHAQLRQTLQRLDEEPGLRIGQLAAAVNRVRNDLPYRLGVTADSRDTLRARLNDALAHAPNGASHEPTARPQLIYRFGDAYTVAADGSPDAVRIDPLRHEDLSASLQRFAACTLDTVFDGDRTQRSTLILLVAQYLQAARWQALGALPAALHAEGRGALAAAVVAGVLSPAQAVELAVAMDADGESAVHAILARTTFAEGRFLLQAARAGGIEPFPHAGSAAQQADWMRHALQQGHPGAATVAVGQIAIDMLSHRVVTASDDGTTPPTSDRVDTPAQGFAEALAALFTRGVSFDGRALAAKGGAYLADYPFDRRRYWLPEHMTSRGGALPAAFSAVRHGIFSAVIAEPDGASLFSGDISLENLPFLKAHVVDGQTLLPASAFVDLLLTAAAWQGRRGLRLAQMRILQPCTLGEQTAGVYCRLAAPVDSMVDADIYTRTGHGPWIHHVSARLTMVDIQPHRHDLREWQRQCPAEVSIVDHYAAARRAGVAYGPAFQAIRAMTRGPGVALATIELPDMLHGEEHQHHLHPVLLDACFQAIAAAAGPGQADQQRLYVPVALHGLDDSGARPPVLRCLVRILGPHAQPWRSDADLQDYLQPREDFAVSLTVCDEQGREVLAIERFEAERLRRAERGADPWREWIYEKNWIALDEDIPDRGMPDRGMLDRGTPASFEEMVAVARDHATSVLTARTTSAATPAVQIDDLAHAYVREALAQLNIDVHDGGAPSDLFQRHGLSADHARLSQRLLAAARMSPRSPGSSAELLAQLRIEAVVAEHELDLVRRCGTVLADVLQGRADPLDLLFGKQAPEQAQSVYEETQGTRALNDLIARTVEQVVRTRSGRGPVRILEVGAGTGATTARVLDQLRGLDVEYTFSDISAHFLNRAQLRFADHDRVRYQRFDVTLDPIAQGLRAGEFDLVIAVNVLHATADLTRSVANLRTCLADGGLMLLRELTRPQLWLDITFGLTPGWWSFSDHALRQTSPLLDAEQWLSLLRSSGFTSEPLTSPDPEQAETVFLARCDAMSSARHWVLFSDRGDACDAVQRSLEAQGHRVSVVVNAALAETQSPHARAEHSVVLHGQVDSRDEVADLFARIEQAQGPIHGAIYAWGLSPPAEARMDAPNMLDLYVKQPLLLCQTVLQTRWRQIELTFLTGGAQAVDGRLTHPLAAMAWGHVFSFVNENSVFARLVDIDPDDFSPETLIDVLARRDECQWALRGARRLIARLQHATIVERAPVPVPVREDATYLITGGYGDLGLQTAQLLAQQGARRIVLLGRRVRTDSPVLAQLQDQGVRVHHLQADVGDRTALTQALAPLLDSLPPLRGIVHSVGVLEDGVVEQQTWERYRTVLTPKVMGAIHLDRLSRGHELDFFILYSSASGVMGNPGQANHAAANAFLDAFAVHRRWQALPGLAIGWGAWSQIGAAATQDMARRMMEAHAAVAMIPPEHGLAVMRRQFAADNSQFCVIPLRTGLRVDAQRQPFVQRLLSAVLRPSFEAAPAVDASADTQDLKTRLIRLVGTERRTHLMTHLHAVVAALLRHSGPIDPAVSLFELGLDSLLAIDLRTRLEQDFQQSFESTLLFDYSTLAALSTFLLQTLERNSEIALVASADRQVIAGDDAIAIIGMGCRYPGGVSTPAQFWTLLSGSRDTVTPIPADRWDNDRYFDPQKFKPGKIYVREGCFVDQVDHFHPERYGISGIEAERMDPQQRLMLDVCHEAIENAGIAPDSLDGREIGVFMGVMTQDYLQLAQNVQAHPFFVGTGTANSVLAGRVAHVFGLTGPTMTIDTACSSSLVTVQLACLNLRAGNCDMALAGGVSLQLTPHTMVIECAGGMLSPSGRCRTFDADADGFVRGEGCGVVVLKRLQDALDQRDNILGIIRGAAVTHDGRSGGLTVPNGLSQQRVLEKALHDAGVDAGEVSYIEAHGTGTALGDPIELNALQAVFGKARAGNPVWVGSVKTNIGHAEAAAGVAGLQKAVLALQHRHIPAHLHLTRPTANFNWSESVIRVPQALTAWEASGPRRAGVSSFGWSGTNAHVIVEECVPESKAREQAWPEGFMPLALLSGVTREYLARDAARHAEALASADHDIIDIAFTMSSARASQPVKAILAADSGAQLSANLLALAQGKPGEFAVFDGTSPAAPIALAFDDLTQVPAWAEHATGYYRQFAAFRAAIDECVDQLNAYASERIDTLDLCRGVGTGVAAQVRHGILQYANARLLLALGVSPERISASGIGLFCAARASGMASIDQMLAALLGQDDEDLLLSLAGSLSHASAEWPVHLRAEMSLPASVLAAAARALGPGLQIDDADTPCVGCTLHLGMGQLTHGGGMSHDSAPWTLRMPPLARQLVELVGIGQTIDWTCYFACAQPHKVPVPNTSFPSRRYWIPEREMAAPVPAKRGIDIRDLCVAGDARRHVEFRLTADRTDFLDEHRLNGAKLLPAAGALAFALHALADDIAHGPVLLEQFSFTRPVLFDTDLVVQLALTDGEGAQLHCSTDAASTWQLFSRLNRVEAWDGDFDPNALAQAQQHLRAADAGEYPGFDRETFYGEHMPEAIALGDSYRRVRHVWRTHHAAVARIDNLSDDLAVDMRVLDACMQAVNTIEQVMEAHPDDLFLPASIDAFRLLRWPTSAQFRCVAAYRQALSNSSELVYDINVFDDTGRPCAQFEHLRYRKLTAAIGRPATADATTHRQSATSQPDMSPEDRATQVTAAIRTKLAGFLMIDEQLIADERAFFDLGMDSITAVEFSGDLNDLFGLDMHVDAVFDYPSVASLAQHICAQLATKENAGSASASTPVATAAPTASLDELTELLRLELDQ